MNCQLFELFCFVDKIVFSMTSFLSLLKKQVGVLVFLVSVCIFMFLRLDLCCNKLSYPWIVDIIVCETIYNLICKNITICIFRFLVGRFLVFGLCAW